MDTKPTEKKKGNASLIILCFLGLMVIWGFWATSQKPATPAVPAKSSFDSVARAHFDDVLKVSPEMSGISCENDDCGSSVVYFNYKTIPDDYDSVIRGNAATFSKFSMANGQGSHVTIAARYNGNTFYACNAGDGVVKDCKRYSK